MEQYQYMMIFSNEQFNMLLSTIENGFKYIGDKISNGNVQNGSCSILFFDWLKTWFDTYKAPKLKDHGYDLNNLIKKHVLPKIENKPLTEYKPIDFENALNKIDSTRIKQQVRQIFNQSFREAEKQGYVAKNPVSLVDTPKHVYKNGKALKKEQIQELLKALEGNPLQSYVCFCMYTGARPSEPLLLTWQDVYEDKIHIPGTKTEQSNRIIPMSNQLKELMQSIPRSQSKPFPFTYQPLQRQLKKIVSTLSFTCTLKDLRHTFATTCVESNVNIKATQKWLGHSNYNTTANIYTHTSEEFEQQELQKLNQN
jgi:integrase